MDKFMEKFMQKNGESDHDGTLMRLWMLQDNFIPNCKARDNFWVIISFVAVSNHGGE